MTDDRIDQIITEIFSLYERFGDDDYIGEPVSQLEHMSQSAQLAIMANADDEVVLAAFFHDFGHLCARKNEGNTMGGYGVKRHEQIGAEYLRAAGFPDRIATLVENHVQAKRYLTFKDPLYFNGLSEASKKTLDYQGGVMTTAEAHQFESDPLFEMSIRLRQWDELAKEVRMPIIDLNEIRDRARRVLKSEARSQKPEVRPDIVGDRTRN